MIVRKLTAIALCTMVSTVCLASTPDSDWKMGEGEWGKTVNVSAVEAVTNRGYARGFVRNISLAPIHNITVGVGKYDDSGNVIYYGTSSFPMSLAPNAYWRFAVKVSDPEAQVNEKLAVIGVSVDGKDLQMTGTSEVLVPRINGH